jgi:TonB family protein
VLSTLRELVAAGEHRLDPILSAISDAALSLTGASGVALAMWKDGSMVCRARSGETAPPLGARLSAETGISGECMRTGRIQHCVDTEKDALVDREVCRTLGLRSIAVIPIQGERGTNGILEVFSTEPAAFAAHHLAVLEHLAALAECARAAKPVGASPVAPPMVVKAPLEKPGPVGFMPASDRLVDFVHVLVGKRPLVLGAVGLATIVLLGLVIWLGWRGNEGNESKARRAAPASVTASSVVQGADLRLADQRVAGQRVPDNDAVWKPNPGGQLLSSSGKPSAARSVKTAEGLDASEAEKNRAQRAVSGAIQAKQGSGSSIAESGANGNSPGRSNASSSSNDTEVASMGPPPLVLEQSPSLMKGILSSQAAVPTLLEQRVSRGVSGGQLIHRVPPVYPTQAKAMRIEGKVVLDAMVAEDGTVRDVKVVQGPAVLVSSALDAVKQWRYKPFMLDGKAVKSPMRITVDFKQPR